MSRLLAVRLDSDGDVLLTGPAVRALGSVAAQVDLLVSPSGAQAARLLPGVDQVHVFDAPWSGFAPPPVDAPAVDALVSAVRAGGYGRAVVFTSFHQSPLPTALLLRLAGVPWIAATSEDYPGSLLDVRHHRPAGLHEVEAALDLARAAGGALPPGDDGRLAVRRPLPDVGALVPDGPYVVLHPGASVPSRAPAPEHAARMAAALVVSGRRVVVTGGPGERELGAQVTARALALAGIWAASDEVDAPLRAASSLVTDLSGRTDLAQLAAVLAGADTVVVGNTGPAHLAAAVRTPVVSLFAPVVPADRWAPWGVPSVLLGDQDAPCAGSRARQCPVPGHPCLDVDPARVVAAVDALAGPVGVGPDARPVVRPVVPPLVRPTEPVEEVHA